MTTRRTPEVRSCFHQYDAASLSLLKFLATFNDSEHQKEYETVQKLSNNCNEYIHTAITEANQRKKELMSEINSSQRSRSSRQSTVSSTTARAVARAEATAALKKVHLQQWRSMRESASALEIQQQELALTQKKMNEKARMEALRLEEEAAVAVAKAQAIDNELSLLDNREPGNLHLPVEDLIERAQNYVNSQHFEEPNVAFEPIVPSHPINEQQLPNHPTNEQQVPYHPINEQQLPYHPINEQQLPYHPINEQQPPLRKLILSPHPNGTPYQQPGTTINNLAYGNTFTEQPSTEHLDPTRNAFIPKAQNRSTDPTPNTMDSYIQFMARRELIANKIQKFDDNPRNYCSWRDSFKNMIKNVNITLNEELSLIIEYTSNESRKLAQRLRNAYINNPSDGVAILWQKLRQRYGSDTVITEVYLNKMNDFPKIGYRDNKKLQELGDLLLELQCAKTDGGYPGLRILNEPSCIKPVIAKLPNDIQTRWQQHAYCYKKQHPAVYYPPFNEFATFIQELSLERNDPNLIIDIPDKKPTLNPRWPKEEIRVKKTNVESGNSATPPALSPANWCIVHQKPHPLSRCRAFQAKSLDERTKILKQNRVCFHCIASCDHLARNCKAKITCTECGSTKHLSALHVQGAQNDGGEKRDERKGNMESKSKETCDQPGQKSEDITSKCGTSLGGKSCSKICLANVYVNGYPDTKVKAYVVVDYQSNGSLGKSDLFDRLNITSPKTTYSLRTCAGTTHMQGRYSKDLIVEFIDGSSRHQLSNVIECNAILDSKEEIPTPDVARAHPHLKDIATQIPEMCDDVDILLLVGRDAPPLQKIHESRNGARNAPWAQRLDLGWVIIGNACLDGAHKPDISCYNTHILQNGRPSFLSPCPNRFHIQGHISDHQNNETIKRKETFKNGKFDDGLGGNVFARTKDDNKPGQSVEDQRFLEIMNDQMVKNNEGKWEAFVT